MQVRIGAVTAHDIQIRVHTSRRSEVGMQRSAWKPWMLWWHGFVRDETQQHAEPLTP